MRFLLLLVLITLSNTINLNKRNTNKLKTILLKYKQDLRSKRNLNSKTDIFARDAVNFLQETERFNEFLKYYNVSECSQMGSENSTYVKRHIFHGLVIDPNVPGTHWLEYKVSIIF